MDERYVFSVVEDGETRIRHSCIAETWGDLADEFFYFLRGCGFFLDMNDLSQYYKVKEEE